MAQVDRCQVFAAFGNLDQRRRQQQQQQKKKEVKLTL
jgi:hypothetical protein